MRLVLSGLAGLSLLGFGLALWAFWIEPSRLTVKRYDVAVPSWPAALAGLEIAFVSDLHVGAPHITLDELDEIVARTNALGADLVLLGGDYMIQGVLFGRHVKADAIARAVARLEAPLGVYSVMGNHDWWDGYESVVAAFRAEGIALLEDDAVRLDHAGAAFWVVGISDYLEGPHDHEAALARVTDDAPVIGLTHTPDIFPELGDRFSLVLAGHTHGGQVYIPVLGRPIVPSRYGERYAIGLVREGTRQIFVSPGIGTSILPVRFLTPPEISVLRIVPE